MNYTIVSFRADAVMSVTFCTTSLLCTLVSFRADAVMSVTLRPASLIFQGFPARLSREIAHPQVLAVNWVRTVVA